MADPRDRDVPEAESAGGQASGDASGGGMEPVGYGRGYGRDFGGGGLNQGFDGSWGQGFGGSVAPSDYREGFGGEAYGGGMSGADYERSQGDRGDNFGADDRSWMDRCADEECAGRGPHRGRGPQSWAPDDRRIWEEVCERLLHDPLIDARGMEVEVENGVVHLRGTATHASDPAHARLLLRHTPGVKDIRTDLTITPAAEMPPPSGADERIDKSPMGYPILPT
jgi:hypothetical protein